MLTKARNISCLSTNASFFWLRYYTLTLYIYRHTHTHTHRDTRRSYSVGRVYPMSIRSYLVEISYVKILVTISKKIK